MSNIRPDKCDCCGEPVFSSDFLEECESCGNMVCCNCIDSVRVHNGDLETPPEYAEICNDCTINDDPTDVLGEI